MVSKEDERKSQRWAAVFAVAILLVLITLLPLGGGFADALNGWNAPSTTDNRYKEADWQSGVTFNMDSTAFKTSSSYKSYYIWKNTTGYTNYNNVTHTSGVISVETNSTAGNGVSGNVSWAQMYPYYKIYFDYTAKEAYADNVVKIRLYISDLYVSSNSYERIITLSAGGVTFYQTTLAKTDTDNYLDKNVTIDVNDLREAIINSGEESYFMLKVTAQDTSLSIANSAMYTYNVTSLYQRDDGLMIVGSVAMLFAGAGIFLVQPRYSLPLGKKKGRKGGF